jgi:hypothetical protein
MVTKVKRGRPFGPIVACSIHGCETRSRSLGLCIPHYDLMRRDRPRSPPKVKANQPLWDSAAIAVDLRMQIVLATHCVKLAIGALDSPPGTFSTTAHESLYLALEHLDGTWKG